MAIEIYRNTKIYIACPAYVATGGPELLHQLGYHLINDLNTEAYMYYYNFDPSKTVEPVCSDYRHYNVPYVTSKNSVDDRPENILIVPEIFPTLELLRNFSKLRKGVWFLSVDNYYFSRVKRTDFLFKRVLNKFSRKFLKKKDPIFDIFSEKCLSKLSRKYDYTKDKLLKTANFYIAQSFRSINWFSKLDPIYYLSDYLSMEFLKANIDTSRKEDIVTYNPKKGFSFTKRIINKLEKKFPSISVIPLANMTRQQVIETLSRAKVYIDFGNHPGKDRLPREAAILECCVITGKRGSAGNDLDVPIPKEYKFEDKIKSIPAIVEKIVDCIQNYEKRRLDFEEYRELVRKEPEKFLEDLKEIFILKL